MSPVHATGETVDTRADLYARGILFYEMLTGAVHYDADDAIAICIKHINAPLPVLPMELLELQPLLDRLLAKDPDDRFQYAREFVALLEELDEWQLAELKQYQHEHYHQEHDSTDYDPEQENPVTDPVITQESAAVHVNDPVSNEQSNDVFLSDISNPFDKRDVTGLLMKLLLLAVLLFSGGLLFFPELSSHLPFGKEMLSWLDSIKQ